MQSNLTFSRVTCRDLAQSEWADRTLRVAGYWSVLDKRLGSHASEAGTGPNSKNKQKE